jgi:hypothetical protein
MHFSPLVNTAALAKPALSLPKGAKLANSSSRKGAKLAKGSHIHAYLRQSSIVNPPALPALPFVKLTNREAEGSLSKGQSSGLDPRSAVRHSALRNTCLGLCSPVNRKSKIQNPKSKIH